MEIMRQENLFINCVYSSLAHAVYNLKHPFFAYSQSWTGLNYHFIYGGGRGTISFAAENDELFVCAVRNESSSRIGLYPLRMDAMDLFRSAPESVREIARSRTLRYLFDEVGGYTGPVATSAFWRCGGETVDYDPPEQYQVHGIDLTQVLRSEFDRVRAWWIEDYGFSQQETDLADFLFEQYLHGERAISLKREWKKIRREPGWKDMLESLEELGMSIK